MLAIGWCDMEVEVKLMPVGETVEFWEAKWQRAERSLVALRALRTFFTGDGDTVAGLDDALRLLAVELAFYERMLEMVPRLEAWAAEDDV